MSILCYICDDFIPLESFNFHLYLCENNLIVNTNRITEYNANIELAERLGNVEIGIDSSSVSTDFTDKAKTELCPICLDSTETKKTQLLCSHIYCRTCISTWLNKSKKCPLCMADLEELLKKN